jgi:hypothetical protein
LISFDHGRVAIATRPPNETLCTGTIEYQLAQAGLGEVPGTSRYGQGDGLNKNKIRDYTCGLIVTIVGLGLYSYYVRELLTVLTLFSMAFFFFALIALGGLLVWSASLQVAVWARPASREMLALSHRLIAAYAKS